ncbi:Anthranilate N-methyltransferase-like protein, partial [Drosera capensis]
MVNHSTIVMKKILKIYKGFENVKWIIHGWGEDYGLKLLKNCYKALPDSGKVIVIDGILPEELEVTTTEKCMALMDVLLLNLNVGAKERTYKEFVALANAARFTR